MQTADRAAASAVPAREVIALRIFLDLDTDAIARLLGMSPARSGCTHLEAFGAAL